MKLIITLGLALLGLALLAYGAWLTGSLILIPIVGVPEAGLLNTIVALLATGFAARVVANFLPDL
jgi:hypothetical protein